MTITNVYLGNLSDGPDPLDWGGSPPARLGNVFPPTAPGPFYTLLRKISDGVLEGEQVDWGASAAIVSKRQIVDFIDEIYRNDQNYIDPARAPHLFPKLAELRSFVEALADERYALVAIEL